jgi:hypothetical protein
VILNLPGNHETGRSGNASLRLPSR